MARQGVTLMCYWNGRTQNGPLGISYEGASPKPIRVSYGITFNVLLDKMYEITGLSRQKFSLKIICRYPACREYIAVPINDNESMDIMFDVARQPGTNCMELYLEKSPIAVKDQVNSKKPVCILDQTSTDGDSCDDYAESFLDPGPIDNSVLVLQQQHRSDAIWGGQDPGVLKYRQQISRLMRKWQMDPRIHRFVIESGFYGVYRIGHIPLDCPLLTALIERWRQETHTFHLVVGEATVTLQDVALLLGLRVDGPAISEHCNFKWDDLCEDLLGLRPDRFVLQGSQLRFSWLKRNFHKPPLGADEVTLQCYARAYILALLGTFLFSDNSGYYGSGIPLIFLPLLRDFERIGQYSWGSAALACLYRELCNASRKSAKEVAGPLILLQLWAWEHLQIGRPQKFCAQTGNPFRKDGEGMGDSLAGDETIQQNILPGDPLGCRWKFPCIHIDDPQRTLMFYRGQLDQQRDDQMNWQPYTSELLALVPDLYRRNQNVWRTVAPLICLEIVEWHRPDRVLRQFGLRQGIPEGPEPCDIAVALHAICRKGNQNIDWPTYHGQLIELWNSREETIAVEQPEELPLTYQDPYMEWYRSITRRFITPLYHRPYMGFQPTSGNIHVLVTSLTTIHRSCTKTLDSSSSDNLKQALADIQNICAQALEVVGEGRHFERRPLPSLPREPESDARPEPQQHDDNMTGLSQSISERVSPQHASLLVKAKASSVRRVARDKGQVGVHGTSATTATLPAKSIKTELTPERPGQVCDTDMQSPINQTKSSAAYLATNFLVAPPPGFENLKRSPQFSEGGSSQLPMSKKTNFNTISFTDLLQMQSKPRHPNV